MPLSSLFCLAFLGCHPAPPPAPVPPPPPPIVIKAPIRGLTLLQNLSTTNNPDATFKNDLVTAESQDFAGVELRYGWDELEQGPGIYNFGVIAADLASIATWNTAHPQAPLGAALRVIASAHAPAYVRALDGGPLMLTMGGRQVAYAHWWSPAVIDRVRALHTALAAAFDGNAVLREVAIAPFCTAVTGEPWVAEQAGDNGRREIAAGYTDAAQQACLEGAGGYMLAVWPHTPVDYSFNPWAPPTGRGGAIASSYPISVMDAFRAAGGPRAIIGNHGLRPGMTGAVAALYAEFGRLGGPVELQPYGPEPSDLLQTAGTIQLAHTSEIQEFTPPKLTPAQQSGVAALLAAP